VSPVVSHRSPGAWRLCYTRCYMGEQTCYQPQTSMSRPTSDGKPPMPSWRWVRRVPDRHFVTDGDSSAVVRHARSAVRPGREVCDSPGRRPPKIGCSGSLRLDAGHVAWKDPAGSSTRTASRRLLRVGRRHTRDLHPREQGDYLSGRKNSRSSPASSSGSSAAGKCLSAGIWVHPGDVVSGFGPFAGPGDRVLLREQRHPDRHLDPPRRASRPGRRRGRQPALASRPVACCSAATMVGSFLQCARITRGPGTQHPS
jgi:hypothetical protein